MKKKILICVVFIILVGGASIFLLDLKKKTDTNSNGRPNNSEKHIENLDNDSNVESEYEDIVGKWNAISAVDVSSGEKVTNLRDIFGSSYSQYGSFLELKDDGTFVDAIEPITKENKSTSGKYEIKKNYNKPGDCYVFLNYDDKTEAKLQRVILDDSNTYYLVMENFVNGYQITFKK